jgi:hypothetical protein
MSPEEASKLIIAAMNVTREDVARAKNWLQKAEVGQTHEIVDRWLHEQKLVVPREVNTEMPNCGDDLLPIARAYSVRLAFYQAVWELVNIGELIPAGPSTSWEASLASKTSHYLCGIPLKNVRCSFPQIIERAPFTSAASTDPDIFLDGICCGTLHAGIHVAIVQSLECFRRGLYMPATAMLAAAAEATWTECGAAIAKKIGNTKLESVVNDRLASVSKIVIEIQKALEQPDGKSLLKAAYVTMPKVSDAEVWTTALRERRNALHWGNAKSFVADHSETGTLLMAAPQHLGTLETIRAAC